MNVYMRNPVKGFLLLLKNKNMSNLCYKITLQMVLSVLFCKIITFQVMQTTFGVKWVDLFSRRSILGI